MEFTDKEFISLVGDKSDETELSVIRRQLSVIRTKYQRKCKELMAVEEKYEQKVDLLLEQVDTLKDIKSLLLLKLNDLIKENKTLRQEHDFHMEDGAFHKCLRSNK